MLQRVRLRQLPASRLMERARSQFSNPTHSFRPELRYQQQARHFHYDPNAVVFKLPLKTRLKYMAYGAVSLVALGGSFIGYQLYWLRGQRGALEGELKHALGELKAFQDKFGTGFAEARSSGDHERLRGLTFDLAREVNFVGDTGRLPDYFVEFDELPRLSFDDPNSGRELVPPEDTNVLLEKDEEGYIAVCHVAVNLDLEEVYRGLADPKPEPETDKLLELFKRVEDQIQLWQRQDRLLYDDNGQLLLVVLLYLREKTWALEYADGHWNSLSAPAGLLKGSESIKQAEEILDNLSRQGKGQGFFSKRS